MPILLRKFTFQSIQSFYKKEQEEINKMQNQSNSKGTTSINMSETNKINIPDFIKNNPTYSSTISKNSKS